MSLSLSLGLMLGGSGVPAAQGAAALLSGESAGMAIDFTEPDLSKQVFVKGHATPASNGYFDADSFMTVSTGVKRVFNASGARASSTANDLAYDYDPDTLALRGIVCEPVGKQNLLLNATASGVSTQDVAVTAQAYTLSFYGTGTITLSGASSSGPLVGTGVKERVSLTFTPSAGTLTLTVSGTCTEAQLETGSNATTPVITAGSPVTRTNDRLSIDLTKVPTISGEFTLYIDWEVGDIVGSDQAIVTMQTSGGLSDYVRLTQIAAAPMIRHRAASGSTIDINSVGTVVKGQRHELTLRSKTNFAAASIDGSCIGVRQNTSTVVTPSAFNVLALGTFYNSSGAAGTLRIRRLALVPRAVENKHIADWRYTRAIDASITDDIFIIAGQSNTNSGATADPGGLDAPGPNVFQFNHYAQTRVSAVEPLNHLPNPVAGCNGFGVAFGRDFYAPNTGKTVLLLPCGIPNTGFVDNRWNPGNDLYNMTESIIGVAMRKFPNARLRGILWSQGERECDGNSAIWTQSQWETAFDAMMAGFRTSHGSDLPVVVGDLAPGWVATDAANRDPIQAAIAATPSRISRAGRASSSSPTVLSGAGTGVHYTAADQRTRGGRYWTGFQPFL